MANERLGIFEELQERAEKYREHADAARRRIEKAGPYTVGGAYAELRNPFIVASLRKLNSVPYYRRHERPPPNATRRVVWPESKLGLNVVHVVQAVVLESGITAGEMFNPDHCRRVAWPRHVAMWSVDRYCPDYSLPEIGYIFHRDHTTVMHAIEATNTRIASGCKITKPLVANVRQRLSLLALTLADQAQP